MALANILAKLAKFRRVSENKYRAQCPVHKGKDLNMIISEHADGKVGAHCFVCGGNGLDLVKALGLSAFELFPHDNKFRRVGLTEKQKEEKEHSYWFCHIYNKESRTRQMSLEEKRQHRMHKARFEGLKRIEGSTALD